MECKPWNVSGKNHSDLGPHNYCRNPNGTTEGIWCYSYNPSKEIDFCDGEGKKGRKREVILLCNGLIISVHGNWNSWSNWTICSKSCSSGKHNRSRLCDNPTPKHGGNFCNGAAMETDFCNDNPCPGNSHIFLSFKLDDIL